METRSKRRRLLDSYVSPPRPDLPAIFESLNDDTLTTVLEFVGRKSYRSFGSVNKQCKEVYLTTEGMNKETFLFGYGPLSHITDRIERSHDMENDQKIQVLVGAGVVFHNRKDVMEWALGEIDKQVRNFVLKGICYLAGCEERFDILVEVWNNVEDDEDDKEYIFESVDKYAALYGKLNVLKWYETKGLSINKESCSEKAAEGGHLHILKWLQEEKGLELDGGCYDSACERGQFHVLKWLREKEVPWGGADSFMNAICFADDTGNLEILQWLHNEGCPWEDNHTLTLSESNTKPELIDWLRANGYIHTERIEIE